MWGALPDLSMVVLEVLGWTNTAYIENKLGIDPSVLSKFVKMRGKVPLHVARAVAERLRTYLRSEDQAFARRKQSAKKKERTLPEKENVERRTVAVALMRGEQWVAVGENSEIKIKIGVIASLLDSIIDQTKHANVPPDQQIMSDIEKQQLIAILETALNVLRSPLVEKGLFKTVTRRLGCAYGGGSGTFRRTHSSHIWMNLFLITANNHAQGERTNAKDCETFRHYATQKPHGRN
jgi:hypothetical protein